MRLAIFIPNKTFKRKKKKKGFCISWTNFMPKLKVVLIELSGREKLAT